MAALAYPDVVPAAAANFDNAPVISAPQSRVRVVVEPTNEEWVAARHALACTQGG
jgi:acetate kinase